ncbi:MAG TPA: hypothetical protein VFF06_09865 [Polyangia bacterium]|nr:hypothetical protein [Polyangia bacterium]
MRRIAVLTLFSQALAIALSGCASGGDAGGGASNLPVSGAGPFQPLEDPDNKLPIQAPFVLVAPGVNLDEPTVVPWGNLLAMWVTAKAPSGTSIQHADVLTTLTDGFGPLFPALQADQGWEAGAVSGPSIVWNGPGGTEWLLFYSGGGAIGWAVGTDPLGHVWRKAPGPALIADGAEEGNVLGPPAAVHIPGAAGESDRLRVYYVASGQLWAADAPYADVLAGGAVTWTRLDGDPSTPARDPMVAASSVPFAAGVGRAQARAGLTPAGRVRHDLYFTAPTGAATNTCGFAGSFSGDDFLVAPAPIVGVKLNVRSPAETPYQAGALLLYVQQFGANDVIAAALSP